jgi:hypothetical protein
MSLVACHFDKSDEYIAQLRQWFSEHLPAAEVRIIKPKETWADVTEMRASIVADGDAAILGVGL